MSAYQLIETLGIETAERISRQIGGKSYHIATGKTTHNVLKQTLTKDEYDKLSRALGSGAIYISSRLAHRARNRKIIEYRALGISTAQLAEMFGLAQRTIRHITRFDRPKKVLGGVIGRKRVVIIRGNHEESSQNH